MGMRRSGWKTIGEAGVPERKRQRDMRTEKEKGASETRPRGRDGDEAKRMESIQNKRHAE